MALQTANVNAALAPEIKEQAEAIMGKNGISVSAVIDALYRQIIASGNIPDMLNIPQIPILEDMTDEEFEK